MDEELEKLSRAAQAVTRQYFGRTMGLYAPLYLSNYCENYCVYCGFSARRAIARKKLSPAEIEIECKIVAGGGIQNILILTGESREHSPLSYIREAVLIAAKYFPHIAVEISPLETDEYRELFLAGVDGVTVYQETYNREIYQRLHPAGRKRDYDYRYSTPERAAQAGIRHISLGVLLGLADWPSDVEALFAHVIYLERKYPGVEYSLSFPRLQKLAGSEPGYFRVTDTDMLRIVGAARLKFPRMGINLSTRERPAFRDNILEYGVTRLSAGSSTKVGGYACPQGEGQFSVNDERSLADIKAMLMNKEFDPVLTDWRRIINE